MGALKNGNRAVLLWSLDVDPTQAVPVGAAVEYPDAIHFFLPSYEGIPDEYSGSVFQSNEDGSLRILDPGDDGYFDGVIGSLVGHTYAVSPLPEGPKSDPNPVLEESET